MSEEKKPVIEVIGNPVPEGEGVLSTSQYEFWAIMAWAGILIPAKTGATKLKPSVFRYECKDGREVKISPHIKTFIYWCSAFKMWDVHEISTGVRIAGSSSVKDAVKNVAKFFAETDEKWFFEQMRAMGPYKQYAEITYGEAMEKLNAGTQHSPRAAELRRRLAHKV